MVEMVSQNAKLELARFNEKMAGGGPVQEGLRGMTEALGLAKLPQRLEAYDISNTGSSEIVASMVVFEDRECPQKRNTGVSKSVQRRCRTIMQHAGDSLQEAQAR